MDDHEEIAAKGAHRPDAERVEDTDEHDGQNEQQRFAPAPHGSHDGETPDVKEKPEPAIDEAELLALRMRPAIHVVAANAGEPRHVAIALEEPRQVGDLVLLRVKDVVLGSPVVRAALR